MKTSQMIARYREYLSYELDSSVGADATDEEVVDQLNVAMMQYGRIVQEEDLARPVTVGTNAWKLDALTAIGKDVLDVKGLYIDGVQLIYLTRSQFDAQAFRAPYVSSAQPGYWSKSKPNLLLLNCPVSAGAAALSWTADVRKYPALLSHTSPDAEPAIPSDFHYHIVRLAVAILAVDFSLTDVQRRLVQDMHDGATKAFRDYAGEVEAEEIDVINPSFNAPSTLYL